MSKSQYLPQCRALIKGIGDGGLPLRFMLNLWNSWRMRSCYGQIAKDAVPFCSRCYRPLRSGIATVTSDTETCIPGPRMVRREWPSGLVCWELMPDDIVCSTEVVHPVKSRPKIAIDVQFSTNDARDLEQMGFYVVVRAEPGESDISWMSRAKGLGVEMICSPDSDCEIYAYDHRIHFMKVPGNRKAYLPRLVANAWKKAAGWLPRGSGGDST